MQDLQALAEYVSRHLKEDGVSTHSISEKANGKISHGTVWNIANNRNRGEVKERTLVALAQGLSVSLDEIMGVVKGKPVEATSPFEALNVYFHGWEDAPEEDRRVVLDTIKMLGEGFQTRQRKLKAHGSGKHLVKVTKGGRERNRNTKTG